jgi:CheY-like chemotaxis protein
MAIQSTQPRTRPLVLVVEDEADLLHLITRVLTTTRYDFLTTSTGFDAIRYATDALPDVITLDLMLPDLNGSEVLQRLKEAEETRDIPVIVVSIVGDEDDRQLDSAFAVLRKPLDRNQFRQIVAEAVATR